MKIEEGLAFFNTLSKTTYIIETIATEKCYIKYKLINEVEFSPYTIEISLGGLETTLKLAHYAPLTKAAKVLYGL